MKQKYSIFKDNETGTLSIKEYAELDKGLFSLIFEETYTADKIQAAIGEGLNVLISTIRTPNLYPIAEYAEKIAGTITELYETDSSSDAPVELVFNDIKIIKKDRKGSDAEIGIEKEKVDDEDEDLDDDSVEIDDLLDDDDDDSSDIDIDDD